MAKLYPIFAILHVLLSALLKHQGQFLCKNTFAEILSHPRRVPSTQAFAVSSHWLLIAQGLGFGNYVVKRKRVVSANNANGTAAGLALQG